MKGTKAKREWVCGALFVSALFIGCQPHMERQPKYLPFDPSDFFADGSSARPPLPGTVARGQGQPDPNPQARGIPAPITLALLKQGRERFEIHCSICHGRDGRGQGMAVQRGFPAPPSFHLERLKSAPEGYFFGVITNGFGRMYSYAERVNPAERWAIIAYIRALQLSQSAKWDELPEFDRRRLR